VKLNWTNHLTLIVCGATLLIAGCGDQGDEAERDSEAANQAKNAPAEQVDAQRKRHGNLSDAGLSVEAMDLNKDDKPDQWAYKGADTTVRTERDMNFDGRVDLWQHLDESGNVVEEEMDLDLDGRIDVVAYYKDGVVTRKAMSVNFDDNFSIIKFYSKDGRLLRVERDEDGDGSPDLWEYYGEDGTRERVGWDKDGDGSPDEFDQLP
jgi:hypothetical protein